MRWKHLLKRTLATVLAVAALAGLGGAPSLAPAAEALDFNIDETGFTTLDYDTGYMYFWHEGLPTVAKDKAGNWIEYPILITWDDKYYFCADSTFAKGLEKTEDIEYNGKTVATKDHHCYIRGVTLSHYQQNGAGKEKEKQAFDSWERVWGYTDYYMRTSYSLSENALLAKLPMESETLLKTGMGVSAQLPTTPYLVLADQESDRYAIGLPNSVFGGASYEFLGKTIDPVKDYGEKHWLISGVLSKEWITEQMGADNQMKGDVMWRLEDQKTYSKSSATSESSLMRESNFLDKDFVAHTWISYYDVDKHKSYEVKRTADNRLWTVKMDKDGKYHFWNLGDNYWDRQRLSGHGNSDNTERARRWSYSTDIARSYLDHNNGKIVVDTQTVQSKNWETDRVNTVDNTPGFRVFYAEPNLVDFYRKSFSVAKQQVVNLDGPIVIDSQCTITVEDGGVLSVSGWVVNNGQILVKPGGTLIVQERDTLTGDHQMGAITNLGTGPDTAAGRISCDGKMIVMRDCKVVGAGLYGLQFGEGAQVVNYGQLISENFTCFADHTIENRGDASAVFAGWGVTDSGYMLTRTQINGSDYNGKGKLQETAVVQMADGAVYGEGADRFYVNDDPTVSYKKQEKRKGYTSGVTAWVPVDMNIPEELPPDVKVYYDERYETYFIRNGGMIFCYTEAYDRWLYISDSGDRLSYNYGKPTAGTDCIKGNLPGGFKMPNGTIVGDEEEGELPTAGGIGVMDLKYDNILGIFWFRANDGNVYHYEDVLMDYIYVDEAGLYHRYPELITPPTRSGSGFLITSDMYELLPAGASSRRYEPGMREYGATGEVPDEWQIYYDEEYGVFFFEADGMTFHFDEEQKQWVFIDYNGFRIEGDYAPPTDMTKIKPGKLPNGILLYDDRLVERDEVEPEPTPESTPNLAPAPLVQYDGTDYYVIKDGKRYTWNVSEHWFQPDGERITFKDGQPTNVLQWFDVDEGDYELPG